MPSGHTELNLCRGLEQILFDTFAVTLHIRKLSLLSVTWSAMPWGHYNRK